MKSSITELIFKNTIDHSNLKLKAHKEKNKQLIVVYNLNECLISLFLPSTKLMFLFTF